MSGRFVAGALRPGLDADRTDGRNRPDFSDAAAREMNPCSPTSGKTRLTHNYYCY